MIVDLIIAKSDVFFKSKLVFSALSIHTGSTCLSQEGRELEVLEARLEEKTERWLYLTELKEKIDAQKKN